MLIVFRLVYLGASLLALAAGLLVLGSMAIPGRAPQTPTFVTITAAVGGVYLLLAVLAWGIRRHLAPIVVHATEQAALRGNVAWLLGYLTFGGVLLCLILAAMVYGIAGRIDQGFAIFG